VAKTSIHSDEPLAIFNTVGDHVFAKSDGVWFKLEPVSIEATATELRCALMVIDTTLEATPIDLWTPSHTAKTKTKSDDTKPDDYREIVV